MRRTIKRWTNNPPKGIPYFWTTLVVAVVVLLSGSPCADQTCVDTSPRDPFLKMSVQVEQP